MISSRIKSKPPLPIDRPGVDFPSRGLWLSLLMTLGYSFQAVSLIGKDSKFIGFDNFVKMLTNETYYTTLSLTARWTVLTVALKIGIGFFMAILLNKEIYLKKFLRFLILIPWAIPQVVVAIVWSWILDGHYGYLNYYLQALGITEAAVRWLSDPTLAFISTAAVDAWIGIPLITMIFISGLGSIPDSLYEAAKVDGASPFQRFLHITLPGIKKVLLIALTLTTIWTFNAFNTIFV